MMLINLDMLLQTKKEEDAINQFINMAEKMDVEPLNILSKKIDKSIIKKYKILKELIILIFIKLWFQKK